MIDLGKQNVLGVSVDAVDYEAACERIVSAARRRHPYAVSALAVHGVMSGVLDEEHRHRLNSLDLVVPDGQPVRWAMNWLHGLDLSERVYGPELTLRVCERAAREGMPVFLYGSTPPVLDKLVENLRRRYPDLQIAGTLASKYRQLAPDEQIEIAQTITGSGARIVLVGLGCPRQETWVFENRQLLSMPLLAVGAAFDFHAGSVSQAPAWLQSRGLEWLYRFVKEPRRLWRRYVLLNPMYVLLVLLQLSRIRTPEPDVNVSTVRPLRYG